MRRVYKRDLLKILAADTNNKRLTTLQADQKLSALLHTLPVGYSGEFYMFRTGAKLVIKNAHVKRYRFFISGYDRDGSDVSKLFDLPSQTTRTGKKPNRFECWLTDKAARALAEKKNKSAFVNELIEASTEKQPLNIVINNMVPNCEALVIESSSSEVRIDVRRRHE